MKEKRKIVYQEGSYQILKQKDKSNKESWYGYGERKSLKGISNFLLRNGEENFFEVEISEKIIDEIEEYRVEQTKKSMRYLAKKNSLASKVI